MGQGRRGGKDRWRGRVLHEGQRQCGASGVT